MTGLNRTLYLTAAKEAEVASGTAALAATLKAHAPAGLALFYEPRPDLEHGTIFRGAVPRAFAEVLGVTRELH